MCHPEMRLLYITPETLFGGKYSADLLRCHHQKQLVRLVVDEVCAILHNQSWTCANDQAHVIDVSTAV